MPPILPPSPDHLTDPSNGVLQLVQTLHSPSQTETVGDERTTPGIFVQLNTPQTDGGPPRTIFDSAPVVRVPPASQPDASAHAGPACLEPAYIPRFAYEPGQGLRQQDMPAYRQNRSHPAHPVKPRPDTFTPVNVRIDRPGRRELAASAVPGSRTLILAPGQQVKVVGYAASAFGRDGTRIYMPAQSTGTSRKNLLCITDEMSVCQAVAIGGENIQPDGSRAEGAKVRVFHIYPFNKSVTEDLSAYVQTLRSLGLSVSVAMHGGNHDTDSMKKAREIRRLFEVDLKGEVNIAFDEMSTQRTRETALGIVINDDNEVRFITQVVGAKPAGKPRRRP